MREILHASRDYSNKGPWYDAVRALHMVPARGAGRRFSKERSRVRTEPRRRTGGMEEAEDVALIKRLLFCQIPEGAGPHGGEWHPMILCTWMEYFDAWAEMEVPEGEEACLQRIKGMLQQKGVETVRRDPHEWPYMLHIDQVCSIVYYQEGHLGDEDKDKPDFLWLDTLWECM